jgi:hypothetical protein
VGGGFRVPAYSRISMLPQPVEDDNSDEELEYDQAGVGAADATKGRGLAPGGLHWLVKTGFLIFLVV